MTPKDGEPVFGTEHRAAKISACGLYRYLLVREWDRRLPMIGIIGLNPSTADATQDDATIRRCRSFAQSWGYGGLLMLNLFAFRATKPADLYSSMRDGVDIVGPDNDGYIRNAARLCGVVVAAWGANKTHGRSEAVRKMLDAAAIPLGAFRFTKGGCPEHPLYLPSSIKGPVWFDYEGDVNINA